MEHMRTKLIQLKPRTFLYGRCSLESWISMRSECAPPDLAEKVSGGMAQTTQKGMRCREKHALEALVMAN